MEVWIITTMRTKQQERFVWSLLIMGALVVGMVLGYMLAMWGIFSILDHVRIEQFTFTFNETKFAEESMRMFNETYK